MIFPKSFLIGQELVNRKLISQDQLDEALIYQTRKGIRLGEALIELGYIEDQDFVPVIADQLGIACIDFAETELSNDILEKIPKEFVKSYNVVPVACEGDLLTVCVVDPLDKKVTQTLMKKIDYDLTFAIATHKSIREVINKYYV